jgi:hypothetical protein
VAAGLQESTCRDYPGFLQVLLQQFWVGQCSFWQSICRPRLLRSCRSCLQELAAKQLLLLVPVHWLWR